MTNARAERRRHVTRPTLAHLEAERCRRRFAYFVRRAFPHVVPGVQLGDGWYIDAICEHMQATKRALLGEPSGIRRLVINIQHRALKSTIVGVLFPAWVWLSEPWVPFLTAARTQSLSTRDSGKTRTLLEGDWYRGLLAELGQSWTLSDDTNRKDDFLNSSGGRRTATFRGGGTGYGGLVLLADDILGIDDRFSPVELEHANAWLEGEFFTRQNDPSRSVIVLNMHRLHPEDPCARALAKGWDHLCLPTEFDPADRKKPTGIGWTDPRTEPGESLLPSRWTPEVIAEDKLSLGEFYEAICNQRPRSRSGAVLQSLVDVPRWPQPPGPTAMPVSSIDPSFKDLDPTKPRAKRSRVGIVGGRLEGGARLYITEALAEFMNFDRLCSETRAVRDRARGPIWVEDEANGPALMNTLSASVPGLIPVTPGSGEGGGSKYERFVAAAYYVRSGSILFPPRGSAPWVEPFVARLLSYPNVEFDDDMDAFSQLVRMVFVEPGGGANVVAKASSMT